ncbi:hypothetical protein HHI36_000765 [Cryptolaemus montrouzieri]|uniref:WAP domain-containing protein n=1 Tax=Cryptolaemus montrouzieri TaxID=559131 RepID=A0ABD2P5P9_9CUCU
MTFSKYTGTGLKENGEKKEVSKNSIKETISVVTPSTPIQPTSGFRTEKNFSNKLTCPGKEIRIPFLSLPCFSDEECSVMGPKMKCCSSRCIKGVELQEPQFKNQFSRTPEVATSTQSQKYNTLEITTNKVITTTLPVKTTTQKKLEPILENPGLVCPPKDAKTPLFPFPCRTNVDCSIMGAMMVCCNNQCLKGMQIITTTETGPTVFKITPNGIKIDDKQSTVGIRFNSITSTLPTTITTEKKVGRIFQPPTLVCPEKDPRILFPLPCRTNEDCLIMGNNMICCNSKCIRGVVASEQKLTVSTTKSSEIKGDNSKDIVSRNDFSNSITPPATTQNAKKIENLTETFTFVCPGKEVRIPFFSRPCSSNQECLPLGTQMVCCSNRCIKGVPPPKPEIKHAPSWFGLVERQCPVDPIAEILDIKECQTDADCAPRICCLDKYPNGSHKSYCRTAQPSLERFPAAERLMEPLRVFVGYMQCTPPPPPVLDLFPKPCKNTLDCFPNLCCQEGGKKYCRPPKRSLLSFVAGVGQRFVPSDAARRLIERLN